MFSSLSHGKMCVKIFCNRPVSTCPRAKFWAGKRIAVNICNDCSRWTCILLQFCIYWEITFHAWQFGISKENIQFNSNEISCTCKYCIQKKASAVSHKALKKTFMKTACSSLKYSYLQWEQSFMNATLWDMTLCNLSCTLMFSRHQ